MSPVDVMTATKQVPQSETEVTQPAPSPAHRRWWPVVVVMLVGILVGARTVIGLVWAGHPVWRPDSAFYLLFSLRLDGVDPAAAERAVGAYFASIGQPFSGPLTGEVNYPLFLGRPLYPLLSAPFVALYGYYGMFVVPLLAYLAVPVLLLRALRKLVPTGLAVGGVALFLLTTPSEWMLGPLAEPLTIALLAGWFCTLPWNGARSHRTLALGFGLLVAAGLSRQVVFAVLVPMVLLTLWARRHQRDRYRDWLKALGTSTAAMVLTTVVSQLLAGVSPLYVAYKSTRVSDPVEALIHYPLQLLSQLGLELWSLLHDVSTMLLLAVAIAGAILLRRTVVPWLLTGAVLSYLGTLVLVPYFTDMRLFLPSLLFLVAAAMVTTAEAMRRLRHSKAPPLLQDS